MFVVCELVGAVTDTLVLVDVALEELEEELEDDDAVVEESLELVVVVDREEEEEDELLELMEVVVEDAAAQAITAVKEVFVEIETTL